MREKDLHAWTEVFFPGYGWIPFDPTSSREAQTSWTSSLKDFLRSMFAQVARHRAGPTMVLLMLFGISGFVLKAYAVDPLRTSVWWRSWWAGHRHDLSPDQRWDLLYVRVHRRLKRWAGLKAAHQTPNEYAAQANPMLSSEAAELFDRLTDLYVRRSFQRGGPKDEDIRELLGLESALRQALRHSPRPERAPRTPPHPESASAPI